MSVVWPTAAAACFSATVRGFSAIPSFLRPAATAPEVTTTTWTPRVSQSRATWAASARMVVSRSPRDSSVTVPLPSLTTIRRILPARRISLRMPACSDFIRWTSPEGHQPVQEGGDPLPGDRGNIIRIPLGEIQHAPGPLGRLPRPRHVHLVEGEQGRLAGELGPEFFH